MVRIGYIGLGAMGSSLAAHLVGEADLTVMDRCPDAVARLVALGAKGAEHASDLGWNCDIVMLCLPRSSDVEDVLFGSGALAEALRPGQLVIDQTSGVPSRTKAMAERLAARGVAMLDAPVSGGIPAARDRNVTIMVSGARDARQAADPVLRAMTGKVFTCGVRVGDAQALKLMNNATAAGARMATLEIAALARKLGYGLGHVASALNGEPGANFTTRHMLPALVEGRSTTDFALGLMVKDMTEALALGASGSAPMPATSATRSVMQTGLNLFGSEARLEDVIRLTETLSGISYRADATVLEPDEGTLSALRHAVAACNLVALLECVGDGRKFGLDTQFASQVFNAGSAWSTMSERILPALVGGTEPDLPETVDDMISALATVAQRAWAHGVPTPVSGAVLEVLRLVGSRPDTRVRFQDVADLFLQE